ncbi:putative Hydrolase, isochorismatase [Phycicoccus elongatus Lp2]|uniref:Putative Hydrolase, isochorismatase n=1 Tax=Phycicoccus elongatus Lp2 TaxID=1193181 RepID=N0E1J4_9MICO|nr:isochorismatase family protein [Phycicoccus elongatus]CCH70722.1 putative Hydrolase, isochorismatase [Phycicoccus elongatus Lp2]
MTAYEPASKDEWLVIIDPQAIFASPKASAWGTDEWAKAQPHVVALAEAFGPSRTVVTRFVADPGLGGSWASYYDEWEFALVPDDDPLYAVVPALRDAADHVVTEATFGKWTPALCAVIGHQPSFALAGVSTDCCVIATALPAADAGATVRVIADACAGSTPENGERALAAMELFAPQIQVVR